MALPQGAEDIFERIYQAAKDTRFAYRPTQYGTFVEEEIDQWRRVYVCMDDVTAKDYFKWRLRALNQQKQLELAQPAPTAEQFWKAAYEFSPHSTQADTITDLEKILNSKRLGSLDLGNLYGNPEAKLKLIPGLAAFATEQRDRPYRLALRCNRLRRDQLSRWTPFRI